MTLRPFYIDGWLICSSDLIWRSEYTDRSGMTEMLAEPIAVTLLVIDAFERLNISYLIGGSLASALHGTARSTLDTDLVAEMRSEDVRPFVEMLQKDFYIDDEMINDAIGHQSE